MKKRLIAALLLFFLTFSALPVTTMAKKGGTTSDVDEQTPEMNLSSRDVTPKSAQTVTITTEDDFLNFAKSCHIDSYSVDKLVVLANDITLTKDFDGVPIFAGVFDGCGHTIDGLSIEAEDSYAGLFSEIRTTGVVKNLNVKGTVTPEESSVNIGGFVGLNSGLVSNCSFDGIVAGKDYVGGLAGVNELTGIIYESKSSGMVTGTHFTGGIAGTNHGNIVNCTNESMVNVIHEDEDSSFETLDRFAIAMQGIKDLLKKNKGSDDEAADNESLTDIGGIAGISGGIIKGCTNNGDIGYDRVGYNIGGIAGRQRGYIESCTNNGTVRGRRDVGGIVGQAEPHVEVDLSEDTIQELRDAIDVLSDDIDYTLDDARDSSDVITDRLSTISDIADRSIDDVHYLADDTIDFINDVSDAASRAVDRIDSIIEDAASDHGFTEEAGLAATDLKNAMSGLNTAVTDVSNVRSHMSDVDKKIYDDAKTQLDSLEKEHQKYYDEAHSVAYNEYIYNHYKDGILDGKTDDLDYYQGGTASRAVGAGANPWSISLGVFPGTAPALNDGGFTGGAWKHTTGDVAFPNTAEPKDIELDKAAGVHAATQAKLYADAKYRDVHQSLYATDIAAQTMIITATSEKYLDVMSETARKDATNAINSAKSAASHLATAAGDLKGTMKRATSNRLDSDFPTLSDEYKNRADSLTDNLSEMNDNFSLLTDEMHGASDVLTDDLSVINDQFRKIMDLYTDAIDDLKDEDTEDVFTDTSLEEAEKSKDAVIASCTNYGTIYGDIDCAGIAGTMAVEYDFDKEGKITGIDEDDGISTAFLTKCILRDNNNYGIIRGEKDFIGGIAGLQELGVVLRGNNYADVRSANGNYVGGIAGSSLSYIVKSNSEGVLSAKGYVGGIAGNAVKIVDCYSLVNIRNTDCWFGAIAGHISDDDDTEVKNNYYTSDTLYGINKVSYVGKASPVAYEDRKDALASIPDEFDYLTITYLLKEEVDEEADTDDDEEDEEDDDDDDDTVIIAKTRVPYGRKLNATDYPEVDAKEGCYVSWDIPQVPEVLSDQTITATYKRYRTSISAGDDGGQHHSDLLVDGLFREGDMLAVKRSASPDLEELLADFGASIGNHSIKFETIEDFETIDVSLPNDGAANHIVRFRPSTDLLNLDGMSYELTRIGSDGTRTRLKPVGKFGGYDLYEVGGRTFTLSVALVGGGHVILRYGLKALGALIGILIALIILFKLLKKYGYMIPQTRRQVHGHIHERIQNKERLFFDEKAAKEKEKEKEEEKE